METQPVYSPVFIRSLIASGVITRSMMSAQVQADFNQEFSEAERIAAAEEAATEQATAPKKKSWLR
jgi:hypothetical protein